MDTTAYEEGMRKYIDGINKMGAQTDKFAKDTTTKTYASSVKAADGLNDLRNSFSQAWQGIDQLKISMAFANQGLNQTSQAAQTTSQSFGNLDIRTIALGTALGQFLYGAIDRLIGKIKQLGSEGLMSAARAQELDYVLQILGNRAGYTKEQLDQQVDSIVEYGIRTDTAQNLVSQFIRYQLDLSKATDLARAAQDTAIVSMVDSSEELDRFMYGIQTYNTEVLRSAGININAQTAFDEYAASIQKTGRELTVVEKQQAFMNAILKEGARNAGLYEAAMEAPGKQLRSLSRDMYELGRVMGTPFLNAFSSVVKTARDAAKAFRQAIDEGGPLHGIMVNLGAVASLIADGFRTVTMSVVDFLTSADTASGAVSGLSGWLTKIDPQLASIAGTVLTVVAGLLLFQVIGGMVAKAFALISGAVGILTAAIHLLLNPLALLGVVFTGIAAIGVAVSIDLRSKMNKEMETTATNAAEWGAGIVQAFAEGMTNAIVWVLNAIANIGYAISGQMESHSPPAFLPDIERWGQGAINAYFKGWTNPDISIFDQVAGVVSGFLNSLPESVVGDQGNVVALTLGSRQAIMEAVENVRTGMMSAADATSQALRMIGDAGEVMTSFIRGTFELAAADKEVVKAQQEVNDVTSYYDTILSELNGQLKALQGIQEQESEQQRLLDIEAALNTGMLTDEEQRRLQMEAAQISLKSQIRDVESMRDAELEAANAKLKAAQENRALIAEQLSISKQLLDIQVENNRLFKQQIEFEERKAKEAAGKAGSELGKGIGAGAGTGAGSISDAIGKAIENAKAAISTKLTELWETIIKPNIDKITTAWDNVKTAWEPLITDLTNTLKPITENIDWLKLAGGILAVKLAFDAWTGIRTLLGLGTGVAGAVGGVAVPAGMGLLGQIAIGLGLVVVGLDMLTNQEKYNNIFDKIFGSGASQKPWLDMLTNQPGKAEGIQKSIDTWFKANIDEPLTKANDNFLKPGGTLDNIRIKIDEGLRGLINDLTTLPNKLSGEEFTVNPKDTKVGAKERTTWGGRPGEGGGFFEDFKKTLETGWKGVTDWWTGSEGYAKLNNGDWKAVVNGVTTDAKAISNVFSGSGSENVAASMKAATTAATGTGGTVEAFKKVTEASSGSGGMNEAVKDSTEKMGDLTKAANDPSTGTTKALTDVFNASDKMTKQIGGTGGANDTLSKMEEALRKVYSAVTDPKNGLIGGFDSFWAKMDTVISKIKLEGGLDSVLNNLRILQIDPLASGVFSAATNFGTLTTAIGTFITKVLSGDFANAMKALKPLISNSPAPLAVGLRQVQSAMESLSSQMPTLQNNLNRGSLVNNINRASSANTYNINNSRSVQLEINPSYQRYQSPAGIGHDVSAILSVAGRLI